MPDEAQSDASREEGVGRPVPPPLSDETSSDESAAHAKVDGGDWRANAARAPETLTVVDADGRIRYANHAPAGVESVVGTTIWEWIERRDHDALRSAIDEAARTGLPQNYELRTVDGKGIDTWYSCWATPIRWSDGSRAFALISADVTHLRRMEDALLDSRRTLSSLVHNAPDVILLLDRDHRARFLNHDPLEFGRERVLSEPIESLLPEEERGRVRATIDSVFKTGSPSSYDTRIVAPDGSARWYSVRVGPVIAEGRVESVTVIGTDVTERRRQEQALRRAEDRYRSFIEHTSEGIHRFEYVPHIPVDLPADEQARLMYERAVLAECNDALARQYGAESAAQVVGQPFHELSVERESVVAMFERFVRGGYRVEGAESMEVLADGTQKTFLSHAHGVVEDGHLVRSWGIDRDVTRQRAVERELAYRERFESLLLDISTRLHAVELERLDEAVQDALERLTQFVGAGACYVLSHDAARDRVSVAYVHAADERVKLEKRPSQSLPADRIPWWTRRLTEKRPLVVARLDDLPEEAAAERSFLESYGVAGFVEAPLVGRDGVAFGTVGFAFADEGRTLPAGRVALLQLVSQLLAGVVESARGARALRASEQRFRTLVERSPEALLLIDPESRRVVDANPGAANLFGWTREDLVGKEIDALTADSQPRLDPGETSRLVRAAQGETPVFEWIHVRRDGVEVPCEVRLVRLPSEDRPLVRAMMIDIRPRKRAEEERERLVAQLQQAQKMEAIGQLTGGVAHDFNNILTVIIGNLQMIQDTPEDPEEVRELCGQAVGAAQRAASLTQRLLAFSRRQALAPEALDLGDLLRDMRHLLTGSLGETIRVRMRVEDDLWACQADRSQLENAIINLAINARDAMPRGGSLSITASNVRIGEDRAAREADGPSPGRYVELRVVDEGVGMEPEVLDRVFEPFFTTKEVGRGSGLGLSMVYGFVQQSGGHVSIDSAPGRGTTVRLLLPRAATDLPEGREHEYDVTTTAATGRGEQVLLVGEDPGTRSVSNALLSRLGYRALAARSFAEALDRLRTEQRVDLLLADVAAQQDAACSAFAADARRLRPGLPVLFTSGCRPDAPEDAPSDGSEHGGGVEALKKPFTITRLGRTLRRMLSAAGGRPGADHNEEKS